jgi:hypothetical protein
MAKNRLLVYALFIGIPIKKVKLALNYYKGVLKSGIDLNCRCGCGGDAININLFTLGKKVYADLSYN